MDMSSGLHPSLLTGERDTRASCLYEAPNGLLPPRPHTLEGGAESKGRAKGLFAVEENDLGQESTRDSSLGPADEADASCMNSVDTAFPSKFEEQSSWRRESEQRTSCSEQTLTRHTLDCKTQEASLEEVNKVPDIGSTPPGLQRCVHHEGCGRSSHHKNDSHGSSNCLLQLLKATSARELEEEIRLCESHQRASDPLCTNANDKKDRRGASRTEVPKATAVLEDEKHHHGHSHHHHHKASGASASAVHNNHYRCKKRRFLKIINAAISVVPQFAAVVRGEHCSTEQRGAQKASDAATAVSFLADNSLGDDPTTCTGRIVDTNSNNANPRKKSSSSSTHWLAGRVNEDFTVRTLSGGLTNQLYLVRHTPSQHAVVVRRYGKQTGKIISRESEQFWQSVFLKTYGRVGGHMLVYEFLDGHVTLVEGGEIEEGRGSEDAEVPDPPSAHNGTCNDTGTYLMSHRSVLAQWAGPIARRLAEMHCRATSVAVFRRTPQTGLAGIGASGIWAMEAGAVAAAVAHGLDPTDAVPVLTPRRVSVSLGSTPVSGLAVSPSRDRCAAHTTTDIINTIATTSVVAADEQLLLRPISQQNSASSQGQAPPVKPNHFDERQLSASHFHFQEPYMYSSSNHPALQPPAVASSVAQRMLAAERIGAVNHTIAALTEWVDRVLDLQKVRKGIAKNAGSEERGRLRVALFDEGLAWHVGVGVGEAAVTCVVGDNRMTYSPPPSTVSQQPADIGASYSESCHGEEFSFVPVDGRPSDDCVGEKRPSPPQELLRVAKPSSYYSLITPLESNSVEESGVRLAQTGGRPPLPPPPASAATGFVPSNANFGNETQKETAGHPTLRGGQEGVSMPQPTPPPPTPLCTNLSTDDNNNTRAAIPTTTPLYDFPTRLLQERDWLLSVIQHNASKLTTAVCHNDLVGGNIMVKLREKYVKRLARRTMSGSAGSMKDAANAAVLPPEEAFPKDLKHYDLQFIDFEYMRRNYIYFDIANHFNEYAGLDLRFDECFPTREEAKAFIGEYLTHGRAVVEAMQRTMEALPTTENNSVSPSSQEDEEEEDKCNANTNQQSQVAHPDGASLSARTFVTDEEVEEATDLVFFFTLVSHFIWVVWSIIQELNSDIDFDYLEYAVIRWRRYLSTRETFSRPVTRGMAFQGEASPTMEAETVIHVR